MKIEFHSSSIADILCADLAAEEVAALFEGLGFEIGERCNYETRIIHVQDILEINPMPSVYYRVPFWSRLLLWQSKPVGLLMFHGSLKLNENEPDIYKLVIGNNDLSDRENSFVSEKVMQALAKYME